MDIYILREGKETGPFSEEATQSMLKQGAIRINDLAWQPGMPNWLPLHVVLYPAAQPGAVRPPPPPSDATPPPMPATPGVAPAASQPAAPAKPPIALARTAPAPAPEPLGELATSRQKAFLSYMSIPFQGDLTREQAALLVNQTMENPKDASRLQRWNEDRLRLHPDLFAEEIKAKKENRANYFFEVCQREGEEFFEKVTKAHTQVLVGYLDVRFPNWDLREDEAKHSFFFPAIAEKFPQLLKKGAKGRFKYPDGPKVAAELAQRSSATRRSGSSSSPISAMLRGVVFGAIILGGAFAAWSYKNGKFAHLQSEPLPEAEATDPTGTPPPTKAPAPPAKPPVTAPASKPIETAQIPPPPAAPPLEQEEPPKPRPAPTDPKPPAKTAAAAPAPANPLGNMNIFDTPGTPGTPATPPAAPPPTPGVATVSNPFDPLAPTTAVPIAPKEPVVPAGPPARSTVKITKATTITLRFGSSTQRPGTVLPLVGVEGNMVKVKIGPEVVAIPAANTDLGEGDGALTPPPAAP